MGTRLGEEGKWTRQGWEWKFSMHTFSQCFDFWTMCMWQPFKNVITFLMGGKKLKNLAFQLSWTKEAHAGGTIEQPPWKAPLEIKWNHYSQHNPLAADKKTTLREESHAWPKKALTPCEASWDREHWGNINSVTDIKQFRFYTIMATKWDWFGTELSSLYCFYLKRKCIDYSPPHRFIFPDIRHIHNLF